MTNAAMTAMHGFNVIPIDPDLFRTRVRNSATRAVKKTVKRRPVVLPVVIEV